jgi:hypothetical protein
VLTNKVIRIRPADEIKNTVAPNVITTADDGTS